MIRAALGVADNVGRMSGCFLAIEGETKYGEDDEEGGDEQASDVMESLHTFYVRHGQEMKDILYQTRLYLPLWKSLSPQDRKMANETVDLFSWLVYEYYEPALPQSLRENRVFTSRDALNENRYAVARNAERIMQCA